jgi:ubiquinone/menaquinone biosynthesis C-methylase UbiE
MLKAEQFRAASLAALSHARGTYIYDASVRELENKTSPSDPSGYSSWLSGLLAYCANTFQMHSPKILDLGCGAGEFTVIMNQLGYTAIGADVNQQSLSLARILASENWVREEIFFHVPAKTLPFDDDSFDIVTLISALEHIDNSAMKWLVPEIARVCRGIVFIQVPSSMKVSDDHTGLKFVPWLPSRIAAFYIALRGPRYRYLISESKRWDVMHRNLRQIKALFSSEFDFHMVPPAHSFPNCGPGDAVLDLRKTVHLGRIALAIRFPLLLRYFRKAMGEEIEFFYPYYNVIFAKRK